MSRAAWAGTSTSTLLQFGLALITSTLLARLLGPEGRGAFTAVTVWGPIAAGLGCLSLNEATVYILASDRFREVKTARLVCDVALLLQLVASGATAILLALLLPALLGPARAAQTPVAVTTALLFVPLSLADMHQKALLQGMGRFTALNVIRMAQPLAYFAGLVGLALAHQFSWRAVVVVFVGSMLVSVLAGTAVTRHLTPRWSTLMAKEVASIGARFQSANLTMYASQEIDKVLLVSMLNDTKVGLYMAGLAVANIGFGLISQTVAILLLPAVSGAKDDRQRSLIICRATQASILSLLTVNGAAAVATPIFLPLLFGKAFAPAVPITFILLGGMTLRGIRFPIDRGLRATGLVLPSIISEVTCVLVSVAGSMFAVPRLGLAGLCWSLAAAQLVALFITSALAARRFKTPIAEIWGFYKPVHVSLIRDAWTDVRALLMRQQGALSWRPRR